jgi:hypothetical protein
MMRKVDVVRPPINYVVFSKSYSKPYEIAWFVVEEDAAVFIAGFGEEYADMYEIAGVRR